MLTSPLEGTFLNICETTLDVLLCPKCIFIALYLCTLMSHFMATMVRPTPPEGRTMVDDEDDKDDKDDEDNDDDDDDNDDDDDDTFDDDEESSAILE